MLNVKFYFDLLYIIAIIDSHVIRKSQSYQKSILSMGLTCLLSIDFFYYGSTNIYSYTIFRGFSSKHFVARAKKKQDKYLSFG